MLMEKKKLSQYKDSMDGIKVWLAILNTYDTGQNWDIDLEEL